MTTQTTNTTLADFIWKNADDLWGHFKHTDFGKVILPFTLLRRLECVLEPSREEVRETHKSMASEGLDMDLVLRQLTGYPFYNTSDYSLASLGGTRTRRNLEDYIANFSPNARVIFEQFDFANTIAKLDKADRLYKICQNFAAIDLHPNVVPERVMSNVYEHLIRKFGAEVNEAAEDFMTPRDVVHLAMELLLDPDDQLFIENPGLIRTLYDPTCGTGGFLFDGMEHIEALRDRYSVAPVIVPHGQELEPETHAVCLAGMLLQTLETDPGRDLSQNIRLGSTLSEDLFPNERFHYCVSNPPFGKKWEMDQKDVVREHDEKGFEGRFGPKLPSIGDGSMLFLQHLVSKLESPEQGGGRGAIILSGSPLFNGRAGQGESEIRRYLLEQDVVEAIIALPAEIFFRTEIATYIWVVSTKKPTHRQGKVQLINATEMYEPMRKSEGNKRRRVGETQTRDIVSMYSAFDEKRESQIVDIQDFGYRRIRVLRPLRKKIVISENGITKLEDEKSWAKLSDDQRTRWRDLLNAQIGVEHDWHWVDGWMKAQAKADPALGKVTATHVKMFQRAFGVRDPELDPVKDLKGNTLPDEELTDYENVPLGNDIHDFLASEILPYAEDAYIDKTYRDEADGEVGIVGYEINFNRYFYEYKRPRDLQKIDEDLNAVEAEIAAVLAEVTE